MPTKFRKEHCKNGHHAGLSYRLYKRGERYLGSPFIPCGWQCIQCGEVEMDVKNEMERKKLLRL